MNGDGRVRRFPPVSPCRKVCVMDGDDRHCTGCGRTRAEIAGWWTMRDDDKWRVLDALPARLGRPSPPAPPAARD